MLTILAAIILFGDTGDSGGDAGWKIAATGLWLRFVIEFKKKYSAVDFKLVNRGLAGFARTLEGLNLIGSYGGIFDEDLCSIAFVNFALIVGHGR